MWVEHLSLVDFRCYRTAEVPMAPGVNLFIGQNGQGKTNLVEAVEYLSTLSSHRVSQDAPLVRAGADQAIARARVRAGRDDARSLLLELEITPGKANRARINRNAQQRPRDLLGVLRTVLFSPEDLAIVKGDPSDRRRFIDAVVITRWPRMAGVKADYDKVLKQRNQLLKQLSQKGARARAGQVDGDALFTLEVFDGQLARIGAELLLARLDTLAEMMPGVTSAYADIAPTNNTVAASYRTGIDLGPMDTGDQGGTVGRDELEARLLAAMVALRSDELARGVSLVGPHRDEIVLSIGQLPAKGYASHGECWSLALALKLGAFQLVRADGVEPVLILDDVFAELDAVRRQRLAEAIGDAEQVLVTAAVGADVPERLDGRRFDVAGGEVHLAGPEFSTGVVHSQASTGGQHRDESTSGSAE
ncbi:DNA replication/repair protein RecF [Propionibacteriaceae bacterium G1746]|uniref:DNA replication/repair protein RecF n=1 Tax=Aestuariimicrobium sp. G57 TaxID=3418485 RepID=UPI003C28E25A